MASNLNNLNLDMEVGAAFDEYEKPSNTFRPPEPGEYTFLRSTEHELLWLPTKDGDIWTNVRYMIQGGPSNNRTVFDTLSTFVGKFRKASSVQDYLAACGYDIPPANGRRYTVQEIQDAVAQTFGPFEAYTTWQAYCPDCDKTVIRSHKDFPKDSSGNLMHEVLCPECGKIKLTPKSRVKRYIVR